LAFSNAVYFHDAESQDSVCEQCQGSVSVQSTYKQTGGWGYDFNYAAAGRVLVSPDSPPALGAASILVVGFAVSLSASPAAVAGFWGTLDFGAGGGDKHYIRFDTSRKVQIYDKNGVARGSPSTTAMSTTTTPTSVVVSFDGLTRSTVWAAIYINGTEEVAFDTGLAWSDFFVVGAAGNTYFGKETRISTSTPTI
jgi:hypothetical protein